MQGVKNLPSLVKFLVKFTYGDNTEHGHGDKHVVEVGEDVLLDGDDGGEEVSEEDEEETSRRGEKS